MNSTATATDRPDTRTMVTIHRGVRRESRLLAEMIAAVRPGDVRRARTLAAHLADYLLALHNHHHGEDEALWPLLLSRVDLDADVVLRMEAQHERVAASLKSVEAAAGHWKAGAGESERDALVAALALHRDVLVEHLDDEEENLLPLAERHLSRAEWAVQGEHFAANTPKRKLLKFLGMVLEDATPAERDLMLGDLPAPARAIWHSVGRRLYARNTRRLREGRPPAAARIGTAIAALTGIGITYVGLAYILTPESTAAGFGLPVRPEGDAASFLVLKGVRDLATGLLVFTFLALRDRRTLGVLMSVLAVIPAGDALTVLTHDGSTGAALGIHGATAAMVLASGVLLLRSARRR